MDHEIFFMKSSPIAVFTTRVLKGSIPILHADQVWRCLYRPRIYVLLRSRLPSPEACGAVPVACLHSTKSIKRQTLPDLADWFRQSGTLEITFFAECHPGLALQESLCHGEIADNINQSMPMALPTPSQYRPSHGPHVSLTKVSGCGSMTSTSPAGSLFGQRRVILRAWGATDAGLQTPDNTAPKRIP